MISWNINGLKRKISDQDFLSYIADYDLIFLNETWLSKHDATNLEINGFCSEFIPGNKTRNTVKGHYSRGIAFYYKNTFPEFIKNVLKEQCGILWIKISKELFPFDQDVFICHTYVPPNVSKVLQSSNIDIFENLEIDIIKYNDLGKVYITGDFNSRTSDSVDFFEFDKYLDQNIAVVNTRDIPTCVNKDRVIDYNGRCLLELCQATSLLLANGRVLNDRENGKSRKENPQKPTQLSSRSHPRHLVGKRTAQKTPS